MNTEQPTTPAVVLSTALLGGWTPISEQPPPPDMWMLVVWGAHAAVDKAHTFSKWKHPTNPLGYLIQGHPGSHNDVTHWMPLPQPPNAGVERCVASDSDARLSGWNNRRYMMFGIFIAPDDGDLNKTISAMDKHTREWEMRAARGECSWVCADCCCTFAEGMPDACAHGIQTCTDIIKRDKTNALLPDNAEITGLSG